MRSTVLKLRVSEGEKAAVVAAAAGVGVSSSEFVRRVLEAALGSPAETVTTARGAEPAPPRASAGGAPTAEQLSGRCGVPVAIARRWLASGEWRAHWDGT